jgi:aspartate racemase
MRPAKAPKSRLGTIGILGGMGPEATAFFFDLVVRQTLASRDREHVPIVVYNLPQTPDRTAAILRGGPSPVPDLVRGLAILREAGADFAVMPCISAHYFFTAVSARSPLPLIHLIEEAAAAVVRLRPKVRTVGLLATTGTVRSRIVHEVFERAGIAVLTPAGRGQQRVMTAIYGRRGIKAGVTSGVPRQTILAAARELIAGGAQAVIAGCTEIPLVLRREELPVPLIDPMRVAARAAVAKAGGRLRKESRGRYPSVGPLRHAPARP